MTNSEIIEDLCGIIEKQAQIIRDMYNVLSQHNAADAYDRELEEIQQAIDAANIERG